ncbi:hypothetical protein JOL62DRAFT_563960 [Phyllosticta paracitricarpa]|uniref:Uncharacterized protein n=1 Tax=Phyllosticta paracitricarpa TaxID=2016321 RepID=A0ABR1NK70_9PEZI
MSVAWQASFGVLWTRLISILGEISAFFSPSLEALNHLNALMESTSSTLKHWVLEMGAMSLARPVLPCSRHALGYAARLQRATCIL